MSSQLDNEMALLVLLADSVSEVVELETLKFNAAAMLVSGDSCNLLVLRLKATSLGDHFLAIFTVRGIVFPFQLN